MKERDALIEEAKRLHDIYEELAPNFGYVTRLGTREFDPESPNGQLMIATVEKFLERSIYREICEAAEEFTFEGGTTIGLHHTGKGYNVSMGYGYESFDTLAEAFEFVKGTGSEEQR